MPQTPQPRQQYPSADPTPLVPPPDPIASLRDAVQGHYEIERELGQGAFATVYLARDLKHERKVAIKVLHVDPNSEMGELRFVREIRMLARLQHPNILPLHDSGHVENLLYYVMPYVSGETLRDRLRAERQLSWETACSITRDVADALAYAHAQGIIHRDIKPENILLSAGHPMLADFGIARAIDVAGVKQLTRTGMGSPGTPAYMSPEQLLGIGEVDARSDIYSLGCVFFEMVTGNLPFPGEEGLVSRFIEAPPPPTSVRSDLPAWIDGVVDRALARAAGERFQSAAELERALSLGIASGRSAPSSPVYAAGRRSSGGKYTRSWWNRHRVSAASTAAVVIFIGVALTRSAGDSTGFGTSTLDSTRFVVVPLAANDAKEAAVSSRAADKLYEALRSWDGLNLVPDLKVNEALGSGDRAPATLGDAITVARKLGAAQLVWGRVVRSGESLVPRAELYDVRHPNNTVREVTLTSDGVDAYAQAAAELLAPANRPAAAIGGDGRTHSYVAWSAYNRGHIALARWRIADAESEFAQAASADPDFPAARLWLGEVRAWRAPTNPQDWREHAERAAVTAARLAPRDSLLALALSAMAHRDYPAACTRYRELAKRDSTDFTAWYGLGECQALDGAVIRDQTSPSGWRWRTSFHSALASFARALSIEPSAHAVLSYERLQHLLPISATRLRVDDPSGPHFAAYPSLAGDTLAFVPYPIEDINKGLSPAANSTLNQALSRNLDVLYALISDWVRASPRNADAYEALADVLETRGDVYDTPGDRTSISAAIRSGVLNSSDAQQRLRLAVRGARILFKRGDFAGSSKVADSLFATGNVVDNNDQAVAISLAALTARIQPLVAQAQRVVIPNAVRGVSVAQSLSQRAAELFATSALGVCGDTITSLQQGLETAARNSLAEQQRDQALAALRARSLSFMVPCTNGASALQLSPSPDPLYALQLAYARKNRAGVVSTFRRIANARRSLRPGDVSLDYTYQEAWISTQIDDTASAISQLDRSLNALPLLSAVGMLEPAAAAAAGRAMILRAELAAKTGDVKTARRWGAAVAALWNGADPLLQRDVQRMKHLAATGILE